MVEGRRRAQCWIILRLTLSTVVFLLGISPPLMFRVRAQYYCDGCCSLDPSVIDVGVVGKQACLYE